MPPPFVPRTPQINMPRPEPVREPSPPPGPKDEDFIDTTMAVRSGPGRTRARGGAFLAPGRGRGKKGALEFVEEGSLQRQAEIMRLKQKYGECWGHVNCSKTVHSGLAKQSFSTVEGCSGLWAACRNVVCGCLAWGLGQEGCAALQYSEVSDRLIMQLEQITGKLLFGAWVDAPACQCLLPFQVKLSSEITCLHTSDGPPGALQPHLLFLPLVAICIPPIPRVRAHAPHSLTHSSTCPLYFNYRTSLCR